MEVSMDDLPIITVVIPTFNHARWIEAAIASVLMQRTRAPVEILVTEDASTDGTRDLVERLAAQHPNRIRLLLSERNLRSNEVVARGLRVAQGRYVCMLDGDDYWTDPTKLQRQQDFLNVHPECSAVFLNAFVIEGDQVTNRRWTRGDLPARLGEREIWEGNPFATCTGMLRLDCVRDVPKWYADFFPITDWPLYVLCARHGSLAFLDEVCGGYRLHRDGLFSSLAEVEKRDSVEAFYRRMLRVLDPARAECAKRGYSRYFFDWARAHLAAGDMPAARDCFRRSLRGGGIGSSVPVHSAVRLGLSLLRQSMPSASAAAR
jgi:glycosyltransferase involved in cell wall biosynthesis